MKTKIFSTAIAVLLLINNVNAFDGKHPLSKTANNTDNNVKKVALLAELTRNLEYDSAKSSIRKAYLSNLDKLAKAVIKDNYAVSLRGHADSIGKYKSNWVLSDYRALAVKNYLIQKGVPETRIVTTPFGSTIPIASNKTSKGRQKNRRVEIELKEVK